MDRERDVYEILKDMGYPEDVVEEIDELVATIKILVNQKKIHNGEYKIDHGKPLWELYEV